MSVRLKNGKLRLVNRSGLKFPSFPRSVPIPEDEQKGLETGRGIGMGIGNRNILIINETFADQGLPQRIYKLLCLVSSRVVAETAA